MNCKPGDLAIIIAGELSERNVGAIVEVLRIDDRETFLSETPTWRVRACNPLHRMDGQITTDGCVADSLLRPVSGLPVDEDVTEDIKEPA